MIAVALAGARLALNSSAGKSLVSSLSGGHPKDAEREKKALDDYNAALGGSVDNGAQLYRLSGEADPKWGSGSAAGKAANAKYWHLLATQAPSVYEAAVAWVKKYGDKGAPTGSSSAATVRSQLSAEWDRLLANVRTDVADSVARVGSAATASLADKIDPDNDQGGNRRQPLGAPDSRTIVYALLATAAVGALAFALSSSGRR